MVDLHIRRPPLALTHGLTLLVALVAARLLFLYWLPQGTYSADAKFWMIVETALSRGENPYNTTNFLNWPPFWMQVLFAAGRVARTFDFQLVNVLRSILMTVESGVLLLTYTILRRYCSPERGFWLTLGAIALNPISIVLTCQHCGFDIFVAIFVLLALLFLLRFHENGDPIDWLWGCASIGLGVLTKTVPLVLMPTLAFGLRKVQWQYRILGTLLLLGPVSLGMSIIYVLGPEAVSEKVLNYRSGGGSFGISGLLSIAHLPNVTKAYTRFFPRCLLAFLLLCTILAQRRSRATREELPVYFLGLLAAVPALGPGYGSQYIYWFLALLPIVFVASALGWVRRTIILFFGVAVVTYILEYAMFGPQGNFWVHLHPTADLRLLSGVMSLRWNETWIRMPLFISWLLMLGALVGRAGQILIRDHWQ